MPDRQSVAGRWNRRYQASELDEPPAPCALLSSFGRLIPQHGRALDLACGLGGNAFYLAQKGLQVDACDIAAEALSRIDRWAAERSQNVYSIERDIEQHGLPEGAWDVIVVSRYLHRPLLPLLTSALKPQGLLFYQTFSADKSSHTGPSCADFLLQDNELLKAFSDLRLRYYREECALPNAAAEAASEVFLIAQKPG